MTDTLPCPSLADDETARRWSAGSLPEAEATAFESHLLSCEACQEAVQRAATLSLSLRSGAVSSGGAPRPLAIRWLAPVAIAAGLILYVAWPRDSLSSLADPGAAPVFTPAPVRAAGDTTGEVDRGMAAYRDGDYAEAARRLAEVTGSASATGVRFFLGVSRLLSRDAQGAVDALRPVADDDVSPYSGEAQLWLAKAWLRLAEPDSATRVLRRLAVNRDATALSAHAAALADSIEEVRRR